MKKVMTFLFAFAMLSVMAFGQSRDDMSTKATSIVDEMSKQMTLTTEQQNEITEVLTDALVEIAGKRQEGVNNREAYTAYRNERMIKAFDSMNTFLTDEEVAKAKQVAGELGLVEVNSDK